MGIVVVFFSLQKLLFFSAHLFINVAHQCVHCSKGDAASQLEMAILGVSELRNPWTDRLKIWHTWLCRTVDFGCQISLKTGGIRTSWQYGEMYTSRTIFYIFTGDCSESSTEKNTEQFQALNGLKCSTVGNLGSSGHSL